jgi:hypothetical protein
MTPTKGTLRTRSAPSPSFVNLQALLSRLSKISHLPARPKAEAASILRRRRTFLHRLPKAGAPSWIGRHRFPSQAARSTGTPLQIGGL